MCVDCSVKDFINKYLIVPMEIWGTLILLLAQVNIYLEGVSNSDL